jgi:hypothetical protein
MFWRNLLPPSSGQKSELSEEKVVHGTEEWEEAMSEPL